MKTKGVLFVVLMTSTLLVGCKPESEELIGEKADNAIADSVELAVSSLGAMGDEQGDEGLSSSSSYSSASVVTLCSGRAITESCEDGIKVKSYNNCIIPGTEQVLDGNVSLEYSDLDCSMSNTGETVNRTFEKTRTTSWGATVRTTSMDRTDFEGNTYGGGGLLTKVADGYEVEILGKHRLRTSLEGRSRLDVSIKTSAPIFMSELKREERIVNGGAIEVAHNLAKYKVVLEPNNLEYSSSCCHPVSGSIYVTYSGRISGTGSVEFNGCNDATITRGNESHKIEFYSCE